MVRIPLLAGLMTGVLALGAASPMAAAETPGTVYRVDPGSLPAPYSGRSAANSPRVVERPPGAGLAVPAGFQANIFADGLVHPRNLAVGGDGTVFVVESGPGHVLALKDTNRDGRADQSTRIVSGLTRPFGIVALGSTLYIADTQGLWRASLRGVGPNGTTAKAEMITAPGAFGEGSGHSTRSLAFDPQGERFYVGVGSRSNIEEEPEPRATVLSFNRDGGDRRIVASGLRNPVGVDFHPDTGKLWTVVNERDGMGDDLVPDYLTEVVPGAFYGWPYSYIGRNPQPGFADKRPDLVAKARVPDLLFRSHSAPIGLVFYTARQFPADYRGHAFVALRGSWNAGSPRGYLVARVPFTDGRPTGQYEVFASGFRLGGTDRAEVWGRPAGLAVAEDGALLIADDTGRSIWRVAYKGPVKNWFNF